MWKLYFLGTSSGTPTKTRNVSGIAIKIANSKQWCLVDCGEGTQHQLLHTKLALNNLQTICITHVHGDHCYGLPGLLASASMSGRTETLTIIGPRAIKDFIEITQASSHLKLTYPLNFISIESTSRITSVNEFDIKIVELSHRVPSFAYVFSEQSIQRKLDIPKLRNEGIPSGPFWGLIQRGENIKLSDGRLINAADYLLAARDTRKIIISGDNDTPHLLAEISKSADVLIHEATYTEDVAKKVGNGPQHSCAKSIAQFAESIAIKNLILTHFSPRYQDATDAIPSIADIEKEAKEHYKGTLFLANDLDIFKLNLAGELVKM